MSGTGYIDVRVPASIYRALYPAAARRGIPVGELLAEIAVAKLHAGATAPAPNPRARKRTPAKPARVAMTDELLLQLRELHGLGYSNADIATRLGVSRSSVQVYVQRIKRGEL